MKAGHLDFVHVFVPALDAAAPTILALHGTGGDENDLVPLARTLSPGSAILSPRGKVLEHGMPRFFRRLAEGVFDEQDLVARAGELAAFVAAAATQYGFDPSRVVAVGFSNGANIASAVMLLRPRVLAGAILFRAMVPLEQQVPPDLTGTRVLLSNGREDPLVSEGETQRLAGLLLHAGADVELQWQPGGHQLTQGDLRVARSWLSSWPPPPL